MDNEGNGLDTETVESINTEIAELRQSQPVENYRSNTIEQKQYQEKKRALYQKKRELAGNVADDVDADRGDGNRGVKETSFKPNQESDLSTQAEAELDKLSELGVDVSQESTEDMTPERLEGIQQLRLIEEGDFQTVAPMLSKAAIRAGLPTEDVAMIRQILPQFKDPDAKPIVVAIANYIYNKRTQGS